MKKPHQVFSERGAAYGKLTVQSADAWGGKGVIELQLLFVRLVTSAARFSRQLAKGFFGGGGVFLFGGCQNGGALGLQRLGGAGPVAIRATPVVHQQVPRFIEQRRLEGHVVPVGSLSVDRLFQIAAIGGDQPLH